MLERLRVLLATEAATRSTTQYQPAGTQYQTSAVTATPADASAGWELFRPAAKRAIHIVHAAPSEIAATSPRSGSPYVRAAIPVEQRDAAVRERDPARLAEPATQAARRGAAAPVAERTGASSTDWLVRTLLVLLGAAILSLVVLGLGGLDVVAQAVGGLGSRLRSRGLGTSRIVLGAHSARRTERHDDGIRYRD